MSEHDHDHDEHDHSHPHGLGRPDMPDCEVTVSITAKHPFGAGKVLRLIAKLLENGEVAADGINLKYGAKWSMAVDVDADPDALPHGDFRDGEGNHIHVDENGYVVFRVKPFDEEEVEHLLDQQIKLSEWAEKHGGITPIPSPEIEE